MPKAEAGSLKAFSNRIKAKGLQKLRWYCQMCEKQCRDENGMKCHMRSEGHLRQMRVFAENPDHILSQYSRDFEKAFLYVLSHNHGTKRVQANKVYKEYIGDKQHVHMNSTGWTSLTGFIKYLGKEGKIVCDETEKGWYITYIDRDPKVIAKQALASQRQHAELDDEQRTDRLLQQQLQAVQQLRDDEVNSEDESLDEEELTARHSLIRSEDSKIELNMNLSNSNLTKKRELKHIFSSESQSKDRDDPHTQPQEPPMKKINLIPNTFLATKPSTQQPTTSSSRPVSVIESLMLEEESKKKAMIDREEKNGRKDYWLYPDIIVKIMNKTLSNGKYYKQKALVTKVLDKYFGEVKVLEDGIPSGAVIRLDQEDLETVIPKIDHPLLIVNGRGRGCKAILKKINEEAFNVDLKIQEGALNGFELKGVEYEDVSKLFEKS